MRKSHLLAENTRLQSAVIRLEKERDDVLKDLAEKTGRVSGALASLQVRADGHSGHLREHGAAVTSLAGEVRALTEAVRPAEEPAEPTPIASKRRTAKPAS